jgi:hypothetical protein
LLECRWQYQACDSPFVRDGGRESLEGAHALFETSSVGLLGQHCKSGMNCGDEPHGCSADPFGVTMERDHGAGF